MCHDKPKYGGPGKKKQCCIKRKCLSSQALNPETLELKPQLVESSHSESTNFLGKWLTVINALFLMVLLISVDNSHNPSIGLPTAYPVAKVTLLKVY